jgi:hypothetical protein
LKQLSNHVNLLFVNLQFKTSYASNFHVLRIDCFDVLFDTKQHNYPHIHVRFAEHEAVFRIPNGELLEGELTAGKAKLVRA